MIIIIWHADIAQSVERILGKDEVTGSNPVISSILKGRIFVLTENTAFFFLFSDSFYSIIGVQLLHIFAILLLNHTKSISSIEK